MEGLQGLARVPELIPADGQKPLRRVILGHQDPLAAEGIGQGIAGIPKGRKLHPLAPQSNGHRHQLPGVSHAAPEKETAQKRQGPHPQNQGPEAPKPEAKGQAAQSQAESQE